VLILELAVVFLGVFIALAADSWSQSRQDGERELAYMLALQSDVTQAQARVGEAIELTSEYLAAIETFLDLLRSDTPVPDSATFPQLNIAPLTIPMGTLDALLETGDVNLLSHQGLRTTIINERSEMGSWLRLHEQFNAEVLANVARYMVAREELRATYGVAVGLLPVETLRQSPPILGALEFHALALRNHLGLMDLIDGSLAVLGTSVTEALGGGP